jgi:hypothetical protein
VYWDKYNIRVSTTVKDKKMAFIERDPNVVAGPEYTKVVTTQYSCPEDLETGHDALWDSDRKDFIYAAAYAGTNSMWYDRTSPTTLVRYWLDQESAEHAVSTMEELGAKHSKIVTLTISDRVI